MKSPNVSVYAKGWDAIFVLLCIIISVVRGIIDLIRLIQNWS